MLGFEAGSKAVLQRYVIIWFLLASPTLCKKCFVILMVCWLLELQKTLDNASGGFCGRQRPVVLVAQHWGLGITCRPSTAPKNKHEISNLFVSNAQLRAQHIDKSRCFPAFSNRKITKVGFRLHFSWRVSQNFPLRSKCRFFSAKFPDFPLKIRFPEFPLNFRLKFRISA